MHYKDVLKTAAATLGDRDSSYGDSDACFERIAKIAGAILDRPLSRYDIAVILMAVKLGRIPGNPTHDDNYVDLANYAAFASHFAPPRLEEQEEALRKNIAKILRAPPRPAKSYTVFSALNSVEEDVVERPSDTE